MTEKYRSAKTGLYVKEGYAKKHPATTVKETDKPKPSGGGKGNKKGK